MPFDIKDPVHMTVLFAVLLAWHWIGHAVYLKGASGTTRWAFLSAASMATGIILAFCVDNDLVKYTGPLLFLIWGGNGFLFKNLTDARYLRSNTWRGGSPRVHLAATIPIAGTVFCLLLAILMWTIRHRHHFRT